MNDQFKNLTWMDSTDAAEYLRISKSRLHNLTSLGHLKYHKMGRSNRYRQKDLDEIISSKRTYINKGNCTKNEE